MDQEYSSSLPILYSFRRCPYAIRARMALSASGQKVELREVVLRTKPDQMLTASPKGTVPVLVLPDQRIIEESLEIMVWALRQHDPLHMLGLGVGEGEAMLSLIGDAETEFKPHLDRYKYQSRYDDSPPAQHRDKAMEFLSRLGTKIDDRRWLWGDRLSLADIAIAPFVRQYAGVDADWFTQNAPAAVIVWLNNFKNHELFGSVMEKYKPWQSEDPITIFPATPFLN